MVKDHYENMMDVMKKEQKEKERGMEEINLKQREIV